MPRLLSLTFVIIIPFFLKAQSVENQKCGYQYVIQQQETKMPGYQAEVQAFIENMIPQLSQEDPSRTLPIVINIPVCVHVIHFGEPIGTGRNISDDQILSQIDILNNDFRRLNADASQTPSAFQGFAADVEIEFCLAQVDPFGNPSNGITRHQYGTIPSINYIENTIKPNTTWNPDAYLNIWSISIPNNDVLGYAYLPTQSIVGTESDGVVINYTNFGYINESNRGRTAVHEIGHYLGLLHIWGSDDSGGNPIGCGSDDGVNDTPNSAYSYFGCPFQGSSCGSNDMFMNYMDYTDDDCMNLFTQGQKNVMRNILSGIRSPLTQNWASLCPNSCFDISDDPIIMGFEPNQSFEGWEIENANNDNAGWQFAQEDNGDWGPFMGQGMAIYFWNQNGVTPADDYLFTPCFQVKKNHAYQLVFTYACAESGNVVYSERLEIGFSETQSSSDFYTLGSNWLLDPISNAYPDYNYKTLNFQATENTNISVGFHAISDADKYALQIDDIKIEDLGSTISNDEITTQNSILAYPNPSTGFFAVTVNLKQSEKILDLEVYDLLGKLLESKRLYDVRHEQIFFDLSQYDPGMYILNAKSENVQFSQKILLAR